MGAVAGGLIGDRNNEALAGAAIGAAVGGVTGAVIGNGVDNEMAYRETRAGQQALVQQHYQQQMAGAVTVSDVIAMSQSRLSDPVIITQIQTRGVAQRLQAPELITLSNAGVSDAVIQAMQTARLSTAPVVAAPVPVYRDRVIVEERYVVPRPYPRPVIVHEYYHYPHPRPYRPPPGVSWGFSVSH